MIIDRHAVRVLDASMDLISWSDSLSSISSWASSQEVSGSVHLVVMASQDATFGRMVNEADIVTPFGLCKATAYQWSGIITAILLTDASACCEPIFLYSSIEDTLAALKVKLLATFPALNITGPISLPFLLH